MDSHFSNQVIPAWYELSLKGDSILLLKVHRTAFIEMQKMKWDEAPGVEHLKKTFNLPSFTPPNEGPCGFMDVFKLGKSENKEWIVWECPLPKLKVKVGEDDSRSNVMAIRATLYMFSTALWLFQGNTGWPKSQLIVVEGVCLPSDDRMGSGALSATLMPPVMPWLAKHKDHTQIEAVVDAMKKADNHMWPSDTRYGRFEVLFRKPKWLNLDVPGNACSLDPGGYHDESLEHGYTLHPHNVDSSLQQLTFLAGLAKLHDLVRAG
jgi:hypothetical protein